jgi:hypothetical protein
VDGRAAGAGGDPGLAQDGHGLAVGQRGLQRSQLGVDVRERRQLGHHQGVVPLAEAVEVEDEAAEVAVGELARLAQEAHAPAGTPSGAEAGRLGSGLGSARPLAVGRLCQSICGSG